MNTKKSEDNSNCEHDWVEEKIVGSPTGSMESKEDIVFPNLIQRKCIKCERVEKPSDREPDKWIYVEEG